MNRILFESFEISDGVATCGGARARHILDVLHGEVGQQLRTGEVDGPVGRGEIAAVREGADGPVVEVRVRHDGESLKPWADIVLAPPRPRVMKRLLPQLAAMGAGRVVLVGAKKVEKDFWGATLLREENWRPLFIDGLMQAGTSVMPELLVRRSFRRFVSDELDTMFPTRNRVVAHPYAEGSALAEGRPGRLLLAIGPEGGWTDDEVELLESRGFRRFSLGPRILRTDTAVIALLSKLNKEDGT